MIRLLTKDGKELTRKDCPEPSVAAEMGVRWVVIGDGGKYRHWLLDSNGYLVERDLRRDPFSFPFADCILRRLCHSKAQKAGWPSEWAELALDLAIPRLWSRINRDMSDVSELSYAVVLRDKAFAHVFRSLSEEREALAFWSVNRGPSRILPERPAFVPYAPNIGSKRDAYRLIGFEPHESGSYCG